MKVPEINSVYNTVVTCHILSFPIKSLLGSLTVSECGGNSLTDDTFSHNTSMLVHHGDIVIVRVNSTKHGAQFTGREEHEDNKTQQKQLLFKGKTIATGFISTITQFETISTSCGCDRVHSFKI